MRRFAFIALTLAAAGVRAAEMQTVVQASVVGGAIVVPGGESVGPGSTPSLLGDLDVAPAVKFSNGDLLNPVVFLNADGQSRPIDEDVLYVRSYTAGIRPTFTIPLGGGWSLGPRLLAERVWNQDAFGEAFGEGLYDYQELGLGVSVRRAVGSLDTQLGLDYSYRYYPNYLIPVTQGTEGKDIHQSDSDWYRLTLKHRDRLSDDKVLTANVRVSLRGYTDCYVIQSDGTLGAETTLRQDWAGGFDLGLAWRLDSAWALDLGLGMDWNSSNQGFYDQSFLVFSPHVNDFTQWRLDPGLHWQGREAWSAWSGGLSYELLLRSTGIPIEDPDGTYTQGFQADVEHGVGLDFGRSFAHGFRVHADLNTRFVLSNQEYNRGLLASYQYYNGGVGVDYTWDSSKH